MREVDRLKGELAEAVKNSDEYANYLYYRDLLAQNTELSQAVDKMRRLNFEIQNSEHFGKSFEEIEDIKREFEYMRSQDVAGDFFKAELCLCRMVQDICKTIIEDIDFDLDFMK